NEYFEAMVACVFRHEGALDKYIGDALMAYWGAPVSDATDADRAVAAALDMQRALAELNARWAAAGRPVLATGIGVHAGDAFVGNIGAPQRLEYTLIGDTVNVASRLCGLAAGGEVLVSDRVRAQARGMLAATGRVTERPELVPERQRGGAIAVYAVHEERPA
ncbi:MAG TPA: adenylate/guanylate cyclase domain-containing protein, partial [Gemmatimonadaceae bacterium]|nr:adenylate/guanylate cyclase domain-containing protein [Gemmatimonadaceae bacterium]